MDHHTRFLALAALALALHIPLHEKFNARAKIHHIMDGAAITQAAERDKVWDAAHDNNFSALPAAEVKPAQDVRAVMLDHKFLFHPRP
jgi:hypothetical protein